MGFWHHRWQTQQIGWHRDVYNDLLTKHWGTINAVDGGEVLVPLCGKSLDMLWLADQGYSVTGLEFVSEAIEAFFQENELIAEKSDLGSHIRHQSLPFRIFEGDVFDFEEGDVRADAWYDRAAMIALPPESRSAYVNQIRKLTKPGAVGLLITYTYPQHEKDGPPYSLSDEQVADLFSEGFEIICLDRRDLTDEKDRGLSRVTSSVFHVKKIGDSTS